MSSPLFELNNILRLEAEGLIAAREKAIAIHHTNDIDAAGDEVEQSVRNLIRKKLPLDYYIGHGHIVDEKLNYNGQYDIVIADNSGSPILFKAENGTEYFPFESLYAVGEVKSTYDSSKKQIQKFINKTKELQNNLSRKFAGPNYISKDIELNFRAPLSLSSDDKRHYQNHIFKFIFIIDGGDFKPKQLSDIYNNENDKHLPNLVCILNRGIIVKSIINSGLGQNQMGPIELFPEFIASEKATNFKWTFLELGKETDLAAAHLAFVFFALNHHLRSCLVLRPDLLTYFKNLFILNRGQIIATN
ncbi:MAG: DUF6602 domain-containing protein [Bacteroidia bacterium]